MSKYNVGDVVKLRDDLEVGKEYGAEKLNEAMNDAIGKKAEIKNCYNDKYYAKFASRYGGCWFITDEMIEGLWEECKEKQDKLKLIDVLNMIAKGELKEGTKVKYKNIEWEYKTFGKEGEKDLVDKANFTLFEQFYMDALSEEVELIEPPCEDEHIVGADKTIEPTKIEEIEGKIEELGAVDLAESWMVHYIRENRNKLNEVIRKINKE